jgi:hypothetical protein
MATVRMSQALVTSITENIQDMQHKDILSLGDENAYTVSDPVDLEAVRDLMWGKYVHLKDQLPEDWCNNVDGCTATVTVLPERYEFSVNVRGKLRAPPGMSRWSSRFCVQKEELHRYPTLQAVYTHTLDVAAKNSFWMSVQKQVLGFLRSFPSVNAAVKEWPELRLYLPDRVLKKLDEKVSRGGGGDETPTPEIDKSTLTSVAIAARMT